MSLVRMTTPVDARVLRIVRMLRDDPDALDAVHRLAMLLVTRRVVGSVAKSDLTR